MKKYQWYTFSGISFFVALVLAGAAKVRKTNCLENFPREITDFFFNECMQRYTTLMALGLLLVIMTIVFFIFGLFEKKTK